MFERIKCYKKIRKLEAYIREVRLLGEINQDEELIRLADKVLYKHCIIKKKMWFNRELAEDCNLNLSKCGF